MTTSIWWIRRDLRLTDAPALHAASQQADTVLPVFILDPKLLRSRYVGEKRLAFLFAGLRALDADLRTRGSQLILRQGDPAQEMERLCAEHAVGAVYAEADVSPFARQRDANVAQRLGDRLHLTGGLTIRPLNSTRKEDGSPYTVFTPFSKRWKSQAAIQRGDILRAPQQISTPNNLSSMTLSELPTVNAESYFTAGEQAAKERLASFVKGSDAPLFGYANNRDRPDLAATSQLSPYLRFGMLSPRMAALAAYEAHERATDEAGRKGAEVWLNELLWREFYLTILHNFPHVRGSSFRSEYDAIQWINNPEEFAAWCDGKTGVPIVDAAMRQLRTIGWMHNRARMIVASFLVKDLLIDWRWGEQWFMQHLVDGDPAANNGGWQWTAGVGTDAAPYFRIFNPVSQGEKFDPEGAYVRQWLPELSNVPTKFIHQPWTMAKSEQIRARCEIGKEYPAPIVDHAMARTRTLEAFKHR